MAQAVLNTSHIFTKVDTHEFELIGKRKCVLISDLSGSTNTTRKYGFVHWASIVARMQQIVLPIFYEQCNALFVAKEADDLIAIFNCPEDALAAACYMKLSIAHYNNEIKEKYTDRLHFMIKLGGIGLNIGDDILIDKTTHNVYGKTYEDAFQLGENVADNGDIVLSNEFVESLCNNKKLYSNIKNVISDGQGATEKEEEPGVEERGDEKKLIKYYKIDNNVDNNNNNDTNNNNNNNNNNDTGNNSTSNNSTSNNSNKIFETVIQECGFSWPSEYILSFNDKKYLKNEGLVFLAQRHDFSYNLNDIQGIDNYILRSYSSKKTAVMFNVQTSTKDFDHYLKILKLLDGVYDQFDDNELMQIGATYLLFNSSIQAIKCVIDLKNVISKWNTNEHSNFKIITSGFGLHCSDVLVFADAYMQFGDALNTASKIGEDVGKSGDIVMTEEVKQNLESNTKNENIDFKLQFQANESNVSGVSLKYYIAVPTKNQTSSYDEYNPIIMNDPNNFINNNTDDMKYDR